jgi:hypothetical protein
MPHNEIAISGCGRVVEDASLWLLKQVAVVACKLQIGQG